MVDKSEHRLQRRVAGYHDIRMDGMADLLIRAKDKSVFDVGCNRGLVSFEFANNGATICHGCDSWAPGVHVARELFADLRAVSGKFEVVDLSFGSSQLRLAFGSQTYDITLLLATYHKLKRVMQKDVLQELIRSFAYHTTQYFAWRGTSDKNDENEEEMKTLDGDLVGFRRVHTSYISKQLGLCAVWERK